MDGVSIVTEYDFTPQAAIEWLEKRRHSPPLRISVEGGGIPERQEISPDHVVLVSRQELEHLIWLLKRWPPDESTAVTGWHAAGSR